jgi:ankyrin repeat protein
MKFKILLGAAFLSAVLFVGCTGIKFTQSLIDGDTTTAETMIDNGEAGVNEEIGFGETPIFFAVENDQMEMLKLLLEKGAKVDVRDDEGRCPLTMAAKAGKNEMVKTMVKAGGNPDSKGQEGITALMIYAERHDGLEMAKFLVENGADVDAKNDRAWDKYAINFAFSPDGNKDVGIFLMEKGAKITEGALYSALKSDKKLAMKMMNSMDNIPSSALTAVIDDDELFQYLLENGANPSAIVKDVARSGNIKALRKLDEAGADPNRYGKPLELAKNAETAKVLVEMGADVNIGMPVHEAVMDEDIERIKYLVNEASADMSKQNDRGRTSMHLAAAHQKFNVLKALLECKGSHKINLVDENKNTVLDYIGKYASGSKHVPDHYKTDYKGVSRKEVREMLLNKGALLASELNDE